MSPIASCDRGLCSGEVVGGCLLGLLVGGILRSLGFEPVTSVLTCSDEGTTEDFFTAEKADEELVEVGDPNDRLDEVGGDGRG